MPRALITGITGFVGSHLAEHLLGLDPPWEVFGTVRWRSRRENINHLEGRINLVECDISDANSVRAMMEITHPDFVFHLAAQSFVPTSWHAPADTLSTNMLGQLNLFEALRQLGLDCVVQIAGSSEEYGLVLPGEVPIKETNALRPLSPYAVSKVVQDLMGYQYFMSYGLKVVRTRAFNHSGPRRGDVFVESNFARQIAVIEKGGSKPVIKVGNLDARRDYTDVRDICRGYHLAVTRGEPGEVYNICSGKDYSIRQVLDTLLSFSDRTVEVQVDPTRLRPSDVEILLGDNTRFGERTGWRPTIPVERMLRELLDFWRERV